MLFDYHEIELFGYTATITQRRPDTPYRIGSISYPSKLVSSSDIIEIYKYQSFLEAVKIKLAELNTPN